MKKFKNIFKYLAASLALVATGVGGSLLGANTQTTDNVASAAFSHYTQVQNSLPAYMTVNGKSGNDIKDIFFLNNSDAVLDLKIAGDEKLAISNGDNTSQKNPAYYDESLSDNQSIPSTYYYFSFTSSLSLYKDLSNTQIQNGMTGENLLTNQDISSYRTMGDFAISSGAAFTPMSLNIQFALTSPDKPMLFEGNKVTLNEEGCYTLVIPALVYYTENNGASFTLLDQQTTNIYYTFMVFDSSTYFKGSGTQNVDYSTNIQSAPVTSSETYSLYHFYNYASSSALNLTANQTVANDAKVNTLPFVTYNHRYFKLNIKHTDTDDNSTNYYVEYQNERIVTLNEEGRELIGDLPIKANFSAEPNKTKITFIELGEYEISFEYLYIVDSEGETITYSLPLKENLTSNSIQDKSQKVFVYGYQAMFSDYEHKLPTTNQPMDKELKTFSINESESRYLKTADITSEVNSYIKTNGASKGYNISGVYAGQASSNTISNTSGTYNPDNIKEAAKDYLNAYKIIPVSTNQPPVKFLTNATLAGNGQSKIYKVSGVEGNYTFDAGENFEGFNQNTAGTYCYVIQYSYDYYMTAAGTPQGAYKHYQVFFFTVTNTIPSVTVYEAQKDDNDFYSTFNEIYTRGFTNQDVFILNNAKNNDFDAAVSIKITAYDYVNKRDICPYTDINNLTSVDQNFEYRAYEQNFDNSKDGSKETKYGVLIKNTSKFSTARLTIAISSATTKEPSIQTFTIDTQPISNVAAYNANKTSSSFYTLEEAVANTGVTNRPIALSWKEKSSGAKTYGYLKHIPFVSKNNYPENPNELTIALATLLETSGVVPVNSQIDFAGISNWGEYSNSYDYTSNLPATNVRSENGIYILQVYDQAGNYTFKVFMVDNTAPLFIQHTQGQITDSYEFIQNSTNISVPAQNSDVSNISIEWGQSKGVFIGESLAISNAHGGYAGYAYSGIDGASFETALQTFLANKTHKISELGGDAGKMNGFYFVSKIKDDYYVKDRVASYSPAKGHVFNINFFKDGEANEGTVKIILKDESNGYVFSDSYYSYLNYPSSYVSFNITSDLSQFTIYQKVNGQKENLEGESYSHIADLYYENSDGTGNLTPDETYIANQSGFRIKYSYRPAIKTTNPLFISYVPVLEDGTTLDFVDVKYYPYETVRKKAGTITDAEGKSQVYYYYYKDISKKAQVELTLFKFDATANYTEGQSLENPLAFGQDNKPLAGKYVIRRQYKIGEDATALANTLSKAYDFFTREITFYVDNYGIITSLESVETTNPADEETPVNTGLESIVGGDIVLNMHSGQGSSDISISFPTVKDNGLNSGSFFTKTSFSADDIVEIALETNKLPLALYIPKYKYTISSLKNNSNNSFDLTVNDYLSYFGDVLVHKVSEYNYQIVLNGSIGQDGKVTGTILPERYESEAEAYAYLSEVMSISEYELSAEITWTDPNNVKNTKKYSTKPISGTAHHETLMSNDAKNPVSTNYLAFFERPEGFGGSYGNQVKQFTDVGIYTVTLYQGANDPKSNIYSIYKFAFEITSSQPEFDVLNLETKTVLSKVSTVNGVDQIYTNAKQLRIQWEESTDPYMAKIDKDNIWYGKDGNNNNILKANIKRFEGTNIYYFDIPSNDCVYTYGSKGVEIQFQFENHGQYYNKAKKRIYFDVEAPTDSLNTLMDATAASAEYLTKNYQQTEMRQYIDYTGASFNPVENEGRSASYIYNVNNGVFRNYAFVVDRNFFVNLKASFFDAEAKKPVDGTKISEVYINRIDLKTYNQSDKSTFLDSFELLSNVDVENKLTTSGYYEVVETDWAGNRTIYVIFMKAPNIADENHTAIKYTDHKTPEDELETISDAVVNAGSYINIYANTEFSIKELKYNQDPWLYFTKTTDGKIAHYLKSPWLSEENQAYQITISNGQLTFSTVEIAEATLVKESSQNKHILTLANRSEGQNKTCYLTVMDSSLIIDKAATNVDEDTASISITVPVAEQVASKTIGYIYPVKITVEQFNPADKANPWVMFAQFEQLVYGTWTPTSESDRNHTQFVTFTTSASTFINKLIVSAKVAENQKIKFTILDNFGNTSTTINLTGNALNEEISTYNAKLYSLEDAEGRTYLSTGTILYKYNTQLYHVEVVDGEILKGITKEEDEKDSIKTITFKPNSTAKYYNGYYIVNVYDVSAYDTDPYADNEAALVKTFYVRLYKQLPEVLLSGTDPTEGIIFLDKKHTNLGVSNIKPDTAASPLYLNVEFDGKVYAGPATQVTTYSRNVTVRFPNGLTLANSYENNYRKGITYSAYISKDDGLSWENIDNLDTAQLFTTYTISGVGRYLILIKYNDEELFTEAFKLFEVNILDSASSYYYITVNGQHAEKSTGIKYTDGNTEYEITYIVALEYADRLNSLSIHMNEELEVQYKKVKTLYLGNVEDDPNVYPDVPSGTIVTEIYSYWCDEAKGDFVIIYIPQSNNIVGTVTYELPSGITESIKDGLDKLVVADKETAPNFNKLKIAYSSYYGVEQNQIQPVVYKILNGQPVRLNTISYKANDSISYIYLEMSGTYYLQILDSCTPANSQVFNGKRLNGHEYVEITFLSSAPFEITTTNEDGEEVVTAPIQKAIYNHPITISLTNIATYYLPSAELTIEATKNGSVYNVSAVNNTYTFSEPGFYTVKFNATSTTGVVIRDEVYSFTIINKNESRYAFEFSEYSNYYIEKVLKDGVDITEDLLKISNFKTIVIGNKTYLSSITLNHLDEKTGNGRYEITVNLNNATYAPVTGERFTFGLWINLAKPPISVSLEEGGSTTDAIRISFNPQNLYKTVGDCYIQIGGARYDYTSENIETLGESTTLQITSAGTYFIQVYTQSGHLLYSYKVSKTDPLNSFAIIAIVLGVLAVAAIIFITIKLRKRQKVK